MCIRDRLICFVSTIATNLFANAAVGLIVGTLTMPFAITYSQTIGINPTVYGLSLIHICSYSVAGPLDKYVPIDVSIAGCAPKPEAIIDGLALAAKILNEKRGAK